MYTLNGALYGVLSAQGYLYDSSVFPAAPYYLAKAAVMAALRLSGRPSRAILDHPSVLLAPRGPYRPLPAQPYSRGDGSVLELPIAVAPWTRLPFIGTLVTTFPRVAVRALYRSMRSDPFFNFELHAVDLLDAGDGLPGAIVRRQRDLAIPWREKRARLAEVFAWLRDDFDVVTLHQAALAWGRG